jgi:hypothetical protein
VATRVAQPAAEDFRNPDLVAAMVSGLIDSDWATLNVEWSQHTLPLCARRLKTGLRNSAEPEPSR